jgi:hypothetical protein
VVGTQNMVRVPSSHPFGVSFVYLAEKIPLMPWYTQQDASLYNGGVSVRKTHTKGFALYLYKKYKIRIVVSVHRTDSRNVSARKKSAVGMYLFAYSTT